MQSSEEQKEEAPVLSSSCQFPGGGRYFGAVRGDEPVCRRKSPPGLLEFSLSGCSPRSKSLCTVLPARRGPLGLMRNEADHSTYLCALETSLV